MAFLRRPTVPSTEPPRLDEVPGAGPAVPDYMTPQPVQEPVPQAAATDRWSPGLDRAPGWLEGQDQGTQDWARNVYNTQEDPGGYLQGLEGQYREQASQRGLRPDAASASILPLLDDFDMSGLSSAADNPDVSPGAANGPSGGGGQDLMGQLAGLFSGGQFNQDIVNRRTEGAREDLNRFGKSRMRTNRDALANRGLLGDGPEITAQNRSESDIADLYSNAVSGIYADESENADSRMMQALGLSTDYDTQNRNRDLSETLGLGNLALGNEQNMNEYSLGAGRLGLDTDRLASDIESGGIDQLIEILRLMGQGAQTSADGYI